MRSPARSQREGVEPEIEDALPDEIPETLAPAAA
jgi:hypothetical protein